MKFSFMEISEGHPTLHTFSLPFLKIHRLSSVRCEPTKDERNFG